MAETQDPKAVASNERNEAATAAAAGEAPDSTETKTYYLKAGVEHDYIENGERKTANEMNTPVQLTASGYESFKDKFTEEPSKVAAKPEDAPEGELKTTTPADAPAKDNKTAEKTSANGAPAPSDKKS